MRAGNAAKEGHTLPTVIAPAVGGKGLLREGSVGVAPTFDSLPAIGNRAAECCFHDAIGGHGAGGGTTHPDHPHSAVAEPPRQADTWGFEHRSEERRVGKEWVGTF